MNKQPEALRLAERLVGMEASSNDQYEAAAELRRLHEENERLREAVAAERKACAVACEKISESLYRHDNVTEGRAAQDCADAIWARGE